MNEVPTRSTPVLVAAAASVAAALVHAAAAGTHTGASELVRLFAVTAAVQALVAGAVAFAPNRRSLLALAAVNVAAVAAWAFSRTTGLPWPELLNDAEDVGVQDLSAAVLGAAAALSAAVGVLEPSWARAKPAPTALAGAACTALLAIAVPGVAADHDHDSASHDHAHGAEHGTGGDQFAGAATGGAPATGEHTGDHAGEHADHGDEGTSHEAAPTGPIISLDDVRLTSSQRDAAQDLIDITTEAMQAFPDQAAIEAAGYLSIGDSVTGYEHFVHFGYLTDGRELDPSAIESIVMIVDPDGTKTVASAMYILTPGKTMADVPDIAGELTTWHDHQNLCWEGVRVVAVTDANGNCPRGVFRPTPPMLHVWLPGQEQECGPFAGIEGSHGSSCGEHGH